MKATKYSYRELLDIIDIFLKIKQMSWLGSKIAKDDPLEKINREDSETISKVASYYLEILSNIETVFIEYRRKIIGDDVIPDLIEGK